MTAISRVEGKRARDSARPLCLSANFFRFLIYYIDRRPCPLPRPRVLLRVFSLRYIEFRAGNCKLMSVEINWNLSVERRNYLSF